MLFENADQVHTNDRFDVHGAIAQGRRLEADARTGDEQIDRSVFRFEVRNCGIQGISLGHVGSGPGKGPVCKFER